VKKDAMPTFVRFSGSMGGRGFKGVGDGLARVRPEDDGWTPAVDIYETAEGVTIVAELAGVRREDLKVMVDGEVVRIYGQRRPTCREARARFHRLEIASGSFVRSFRITVPFDPRQVEARTEDGMLLVHLPKKPEPETKHITVEHG
jgi:HSP20 family protein